MHLTTPRYSRRFHILHTRFVLAHMVMIDIMRIERISSGAHTEFGINFRGEGLNRCGFNLPNAVFRKARNGDAPIVIGDGGDIVATAAKIIPVKGEGAWMDPGPLGTLGVGMPFALAAQLAHPDKRIVIVYGDGSFGLNGFEYDTAVRFGLPIVGIVGNDGAWGQMMRPQGAMYGSYDNTLLNFTRYDKVVEALGGHGEFVEHPEDLRPALERAAASGKPALVNVIIRQDREYSGGIYV